MGVGCCISGICRVAQSVGWFGLCLGRAWGGRLPFGCRPRVWGIGFTERAVCRRQSARCLGESPRGGRLPLGCRPWVGVSGSSGGLSAVRQSARCLGKALGLAVCLLAVGFGLGGQVITISAGEKVVQRYRQLPRHPRRVAGISAGVGDKATRSRGLPPADL